MSTSLDDSMVAQALGDLSQADELPAATVVALRLADVLTSDSPTVDAAFYAELKGHFTPGQILELGSALAVASGWQTFIEAFGIRPDSPWLDGVVEP